MKKHKSKIENAVFEEKVIDDKSFVKMILYKNYNYFDFNKHEFYYEIINNLTEFVYKFSNFELKYMTAEIANLKFLNEVKQNNIIINNYKKLTKDCI